MNLKKYLLPGLVAACGFAASVFAAEDYATVREARDNTDPRALADFVKSKGMISIQEKGGALMLSGDVRTEWDHVKSHNGGKHLRGNGSSHGLKSDKPLFTVPSNEFDIEANLMLDYRADRSWGKLRFQFDNAAGIRQRSSDEMNEWQINKKDTLFGSGTLNKLALRQAYMGYNVSEAGTSRLDLEAGRRRLYDVFDSKLQFDNYFDGVLLKYMNSFEGVTDFALKAAAFVINQNVNHFGYVAEADFLNLGDERLDFKYAYTHWHKDGVNIFNKKNGSGSRFNISQFLLAYNFAPDFLRYKTTVYAAYLKNHEAHAKKWTDHKKMGQAFYVGFKVGEPKRQGDWAFEADYQWMQVNAVPEQDVRGIGRDNPRNISVYKKGHKFGFANYKGYELLGMYNLTDNLAIEAGFSRVHQQSRRVGGNHRAWAFELATVYAF